MSTANAEILNSDTVSTNNLIVGNSSSNLSITPNNTTFNIGANVIINSTAVFVGNATVNTVVNATALTTNSITINSITYNTVSTSTTAVNYQEFITTGWGLWTKPADATDNDLVTIMIWGGGGGYIGSQDSSGGGGACVIVNKLASECNATCNVYVGAGGISNVSGATGVTAGETSVFWTNSTFSISAYGGSHGTASVCGGGGGGWFSAGNTAGAGGGLLGGAVGGPGGTSTFGGGGGTNSTTQRGGSSVYGGGGGGRGSSSGGGGGNSVFGGAGGGSATAVAGVSVFGGNGGNSTVAPTAPGGGGSGRIDVGAFNGARGEVRVWVYRVG